MIALEYTLERSPRGDRGRGFISSMVLLVGVVGTVFVVWQGLNVAYRFYDLRNQVTYLLSLAEITPDLEIKKRVIGAIKGAGMSSNEQDIVLDRQGDRVRAELPYRHDLVLLVAGRRFRLASIPLRLSVERRLKQASEGYNPGVPVQGNAVLR
jgi:hypothetical protein